MQDYAIVTDSASDLPREWIEELEVGFTSLQFTIAGHTYFDNSVQPELEPLAFYQLMREGHTGQTAQVNNQQFVELFEPLLQSGKDILYLGFSSGLSGTYNSSLMAAQELAPRYPQRKIVTIDTLAGSLGLGMVVYEAVARKRAGLSLEEVAEWVERQRPHTCHYVAVDDLVYLKRGGRISAAASMVGSVLKVKPIIHVDAAGRLVSAGKVRGRKQSLAYLVQTMRKLCVQPEGQTVFISHSDTLEDAEYVAQMIKEALKVKEVKISLIGPVIGSHTGPGTIALFFYGSHR